MASIEVREDLVQLTVAAHDAAPDAALMRELEAIVDGGGSLLDAAEALTSGDRWDALYPSSQTPAEFSDVWLGTLLPGVSAELLAFGRTVVVPHIEAGNGPAGLVLAAQDFLSAPGVPADFAGFASAFLERSASAMEELADSERVEDLVQLTVAAYGAAPGAALMAELEAAAAGGLSAAAEVLVENERWEALYPSTQTSAEFSDAWLAVLLPGVGADLLAVGRAVVVPHIEGGGAPAELLLLAQGLLSAPLAPAGFADFAEAFLNRGEVAAEHSVVRMLDGTAAELSGALASVTDDDATVQAAIDALDALDDPMSGDQMPGGGGTGGGSGGGGTGGGSGGGGTGGGSGGGGTGGGSGGGGTGGGSGGGGTGGGSGGGGTGGGSGGGGTGGGSGGGGTGGGSGGGGTGGGSGGQMPAPIGDRDATDDQGRVVLAEFDDDEDGTFERAEAYEYGAGDLKTKTTWYDDWALEADGAGKSLDMQTIDRALEVEDGDGDGTGDSRRFDVYDADGDLVVRSLFDEDNAADGSWERAEGYDYDDEGRLILKKTDDAVEGTEPESATVDYGEAEAYAYGDGTDDADRRIRTDFYDSWDDNHDTADLATLDIDRSAHFFKDYDGDGGTDDSKTETFDGEGRAERIAYDHGADGTVDRVEKYAYEGADRHWKTQWTNADAAADDAFERVLSATRDADGRINALDASGSTAGVKLDDALAGNTGELTVTATGFDDAIANEKGIEGGSKAEGTLGTGQTFNLGDGADAFTVRRAALAEDEFDNAGMRTKSAPRLTVDAGEGDDVITAPVDAAGAITADGGKGDDTFKFVDGDFQSSKTTESGHFISFDGGPGDDTLLIEADPGGDHFSPSPRIANVENIHLALADSGADGRMTARLFVADGFSDAVTVTSGSAATLTAEDLVIRFVLDPDADGGSVDVGNIDASGIDAAVRPRIYAEGGAGDDVLTGGAGPTVFEFNTLFGTAGGGDRVMGYNAAEGDKILIAGGGVKDDATTVTAEGSDTVIVYTLVDGAGAETEHKITVEGVKTGVTVVSETAGGTAEISYGGRSIGPSRTGGKLVGEGFDDDDDGTMDRYETYTRGADGFVSKREIEYGDGVTDESPDRKREEVYDKGVLTEIKHDLDADGTWDLIDAYTYEDWDTRPVWIARTETQDNDDAADDASTKYSLYNYYGGDGADGRVGGYETVDSGTKTGHKHIHPEFGYEWILAGPGDDVIRGRDEADWFIVDAGDGEDTILDFDPTDDRDRIWIREEGVAFSDLAFTDLMRKEHPDSNSKTDGVVVSWGGEERLWLPGHSKADLAGDKGYFFFGDEHIVVPDAVGREYVRDASGRTTEVRYFDGWDGEAGFDSLDPDRVQKYAYEGDETRWSASSINANPFEDDVFETRVSVVRYGNGAPVSREFAFDDGSGGGAAGDGEVDRIRRDVFDREGRIAEIRHDIDADGTWDHIDAVAYDTTDKTDTRSLLPRARSVERVIDSNDDGSADDTADAVRLVFGTDGHDRENAALRGTGGDEWFVPGPGDDLVDVGLRVEGDNDVFIFDYGDGNDLLDVFARGATVTDRIWVRGPDYSGDAVSGGASVGFSGTDRYHATLMPFPIEVYGNQNGLIYWYYSGAQALDRVMLYGWDFWDRDHWRPRFSAPETVPHDPDSFIYGSRNAAWTLDGAGRVTEIRFFDAWDGMGDPSIMQLAPDRVHRYAYEGDGTDWKTLSKNDNALEDDVFEYQATAEGRDPQGRIFAQTVLFDDGLGIDPGLKTANDGTWDRREETAIDTSFSQVESIFYDNNNDGTWEVTEYYTYPGQSTTTPSQVRRPIVGTFKFVGGSDGDDDLTGTDDAEWVDAGKGADTLTGGGGGDVFIFRYGDGTDVIEDFELMSDTIWIKEYGFDPAHVEATLVELDSDGDPDHPYIPTDLHPSGSGTTKVTVLTYGGGEDDRLIIVGGTEDADAYRAHFVAYGGHMPDFSGG